MAEIEAAQSPAPRFPKPKILVIDCDSAVAECLINDGYNVKSGTFGRPYKVSHSDKYTPVIVRPSLPNHAEQEIVIIDLSPPETVGRPEGPKTVSFGTDDWWASMKVGFVDPRPRAMALAQGAFDRLFNASGIFVVFCEPRLSQELWFTTGNEYGTIARYPKKSSLTIGHSYRFSTKSICKLRQNTALRLTLCLALHRFRRAWLAI